MKDKEEEISKELEEHPAAIPHVSIEEAEREDEAISNEMRADSALYAAIAAFYKLNKQAKVTTTFILEKLKEEFNWTQERIKEETKKQKKPTKRTWGNLLWKEIEDAASHRSSSQNE